MIRFGRLNLAFLLLLALPLAASAQKDTRQTKEASKYIGLAMTKQDPDERASMFREALVHVHEAMERDADNPRVWLLGGVVLAALGDMEEADEAFARAEQMHPAYAEDIEGERQAAWIGAFNRGIEAMDAQDYERAIGELEGAQVIYPHRPEALMNLGALYANRGDNAAALEAFRNAMEATEGPLFEQIEEEEQASWLRLRTIAVTNIAQIHGAEGVERFQAQEFEEATEQFRLAAEANPYARDYWFNQVQGLWAQASRLEDELEEDLPEAEAAETRERLIDVYDRIVETAQKTREFDPENEVLYMIEARAHRMRGEFSDSEETAKAGRDEALRLLQQHEDTGIHVDDIIVTATGDEGATISGTITNKRVEEGTPVTLRFTLLGSDGASLGEDTVTVNAPASDEVVEFELPVAYDSPEGADAIAGWKYAFVQ